MVVYNETLMLHYPKKWYEETTKGSQVAVVVTVMSKQLLKLKELAKDCTDHQQYLMASHWLAHRAVQESSQEEILAM
ncbi:MAG: hypothetical protein CBC48_02405 [bacterium TMED88]|nr:MAG: hypothetical protein CBC48_02405 [bacterium TMED88]